MTTFSYDDVYTPDFSTEPNLPVDLNAPYTVYNLKIDAQYSPNTPNFFVYEPVTSTGYSQLKSSRSHVSRATSKSSSKSSSLIRSASLGSASQAQRDPSVNIEDVLRRNPKAWKAYKSGNFVVKQYNTPNGRKIVLKEKSNGDTSDESNYIIKKYTVRIGSHKKTHHHHHHHHHHSEVVSDDEDDADHILLVQYNGSPNHLAQLNGSAEFASAGSGYAAQAPNFATAGSGFALHPF